MGMKEEVRQGIDYHTFVDRLPFVSGFPTNFGTFIASK
jgi:hypothetical protein